MGACDNLCFAEDTVVLGALERHIRRQLEPSQWYQECDEDFRASDLTKWLPKVRRVLHRLRLNYDHSTHSISWNTVDSNGAVITRYYQFGFDSSKVLLRLREEMWLRKMYQKDKRVTGQCQRRSDDNAVINENQASGLTVDPPPKIGVAYLGAHRKFLAHQPSPLLRQIAVGSGLSYWHANCSLKHAGHVQEAIEGECMCGLAKPRMPDIIWTCEATLLDRHSTCPAGPQTICEERLLCREFPYDYRPWCQSLHHQL